MPCQAAPQKSFRHLKVGDTCKVVVVGPFDSREVCPWDVVHIYEDGTINFGGPLDFHPDTGKAVNRATQPWPRESFLHPDSSK